MAIIGAIMLMIQRNLKQKLPSSLIQKSLISLTALRTFAYIGNSLSVLAGMRTAELLDAIYPKVNQFQTSLVLDYAMGTSLFLAINEIATGAIYIVFTCEYMTVATLLRWHVQ